MGGTVILVGSIVLGYLFCLPGGTHTYYEPRCNASTAQHNRTICCFQNATVCYCTLASQAESCFKTFQEKCNGFPHMLTCIKKWQYTLCQCVHTPIR
uniref:Uncharacterized protein n=1 Tax=Rhipicephalus appendiculatus TaxID=34631 RepID=A0A131Z755_RHIAP